MSTPNYYVKGTGFWYGQVRLTDDPEKLGRVKVRILGIHTKNTSLLPDEDLPWASIQQSPNGWANFSPLLPKTWVVGYFADGAIGQQPIIMGVIPQIYGEPEDYTTTTNGDSEVIKTELVAKTDRKDIIKWGTAGTSSVSRAATGDIQNTVIAKTNANLTHVCDFRYFVNIPSLDIGLGQFVDPVRAIQDAIRGGKNQAAQITSLLLSQINAKLRAVIDALVSSLGMDPSGQTARTFTVAKDLFREINKYTKMVAEQVELASMYYNLVKSIQTVVDYLNSLPQRLQAMLKACVAQFMGSVNSFVNQLKAMPGVVTNQVDTILNELGVATQNKLDTATASQANTALANTSSNTTTSVANTNNMTSIISTAVYNLDETLVTAVTDYINSSANANSVLTTAQSNTYDPTKLQAP